MNFGLIIVGDEILSGKRSDKHMAKVIELLAARGLVLSWAHYVGDEPGRITAELRQAFASGDVEPLNCIPSNPLWKARSAGPSSACVPPRSALSPRRSAAAGATDH